MRLHGATGSPLIGPDGRAFIWTASRERQYLETAAPTDALHANPGFEDETAGVPDDWNFFWATGTTAVASDTVTVYSGTRSLEVHTEGGGEQIAMSDTFDVIPGGLVEFSAFATSTEGSPIIYQGLLTKASGTPDLFDDGTRYHQDPGRPIAAARWERYDRQIEVPGGHTRGRVVFRVGATASEDVTAYLDLTASSVTAPAVEDSGWVALPFTSNWADAGFGWQPCEYRRRGDDLEIRGLGARSTSATGAGATVATLPAGFRPVATYTPIGDTYTSSANLPVPSSIYLTSGGDIVTTESIPAGAFLPFRVERLSLL